MKRNPPLKLFWSVALAMSAAVVAGRAAAVVLPDDAAAALGTSTNRGLIAHDG